MSFWTPRVDRDRSPALGLALDAEQVVGSAPQNLGSEVKVEAWREHYNRERPHSGLGNLAPEEFVRQDSGRGACFDLLEQELIAAG